MIEDAFTCVGIMYAYYTSALECETPMSFFVVSLYRAFIYGIEFAIIGFIFGELASYLKNVKLPKIKMRSFYGFKIK